MKMNALTLVRFLIAALLLQAAGGVSAAEVPEVGPGRPVAPQGGTPSNPVDKYAVILNGDTEKRHQQNADDFFVFFRDYYGIKPANIFVLTTHKTAAPNARAARISDLAAVHKELAGKIDANDELYLYTTGHGAQILVDTTTHTIVALQGDAALPAAAYANAWLGTSAARFTFVGDQCNSGAFAKAMTADASKNVLAISSVDPDNSTVCSFFTPPFLDAFKDMKNDNDPKDGRVSEWEAFKAATKISEISHAYHGFPAAAASTQYMTSGSVKNPAKKKKPAPSKSAGNG